MGTTLAQAFVSEIVGSAVLIVLGCGVVANVVLPKNKGNSSGWIVISFGWGFAVMAGVYASFKSGAHINPAVTLGLLVRGSYFDTFSSTGSISPTFGHMLLYWAGQLIGAFIGAIFTYLAYKKHFDEDAPAADKLGVFSTGPAIRSYAWNFITELIGTFVLVFVVISFGKSTTGLGPLAVALLVVGIGLSLGGPTGYAINPSRDFGPRLAHAVLPIPGKGSSDWAYSWVPILGPLAGGALAGLASIAYIAK